MVAEIYLAAFLTLVFNFTKVEEKLFISFERSGGFAGITQSIEIDGDTLSTDEVKKLSQLIDDADFFSLQLGKSNLPDQFYYKIEILKGDQKGSIEFGESSAPDKLIPLLDYLSKMARQRR